MLSAVHWSPLPHGRVSARRIFFLPAFSGCCANKKAPESCDPGAPVENGFKPRSFLPAAAFYLTSVRVKKHRRTCWFFQPPPANQTVLPQSGSLPSPSVSDGGLFSSTLGVKRQAPPLPCFVLDKKLTIRVAPVAADLAACGVCRAG